MGKITSWDLAKKPHYMKHSTSTTCGLTKKPNLARGNINTVGLGCYSGLLQSQITERKQHIRPLSKSNKEGCMQTRHTTSWQ